LNEGRLRDIAQQLNLDMTIFIQCTGTEKHKDRLIAAKQQAEIHKISGTPTYFINGKRYVGLKPYAELKELLISAH
jgi:protein-disulfide isomerase